MHPSAAPRGRNGGRPAITLFVRLKGSERMMYRRGHCRTLSGHGNTCRPVPSTGGQEALIRAVHTDT